MATKAELEAEVERLRAQLDAQQRNESAGPARQEEDDSTPSTGLPRALTDLLSESGFDGSNAEAIAHQLSDELNRFRREYPLLSLLGAFTLGCMAGRVLK